MSQSVNVSVCPFHRYMHKYGPLCPHHCATDRCGLPPLHRASPAARLPTYSSSWKRSRWPHDLLFEEDLVDTQSRPSTIQLHPREIRHICWTLLEWYSVSLWALVKIHLHVYGQPGTRINRCFTRFKLLLCCWTMNRIMSMISKKTVSSSRGNNKWVLCVHSFVKKSGAVWRWTSKVEEAEQVST